MFALLNRKLLSSLVAAALVGLAGVAAAADPIRPFVPPPPPLVRPAAPQPDYAKERSQWQTDNMRKGFPRLGENFEIVGPATKDFNAYSHALGLDRWVAPEAGTADNPLAGADRLLGQYRYQRLADLDLSAKRGVEKVVLYVTVNPDGTVKDVTSAARQEADGTWTMKVGQMHTIRIKDPYLLQGPTYGLPYVVYAR